MEEEVFFNGFCRTLNQSNMVACVFIKEEKWELTEADCAMAGCVHRAACGIAKQADAWVAEHDHETA